ncbi:MAG: ABC transporter substrate-binding protein [Planktomarina sp.]|nr:ABC transporter substrate-binding protein [Planktomarina sp.]
MYEEKNLPVEAVDEARRGILKSALAIGVTAASAAGMSSVFPMRALAQDGTPSGSIVFGNAEPPTSNYWDPAAGFGLVDEQVASLLYDSLLAFDENGNITPGIAITWAATDDKTVALTIRTDVKFHDGTLVTAQDIKASIDRLGLGELAQSMVVTSGISVNILSDDKIEVTSPQVFGPMMNALAYIKILPKTNIDNPDSFKGAANGSGPYKFISYSGNIVTLEANNEYWRGAPKIKSVTFRYIADAQARISALLSGQIDILSRVSPEDLARVEGNDEFHVTDVSPPSQIIAIYQHNGPLGNPMLRRALAHAIDREGIAKNIMKGLNKVGSSSLPTNVSYYEDQEQKFDYDPEKARALVSEAFPDGVTLRMSTSTLVPNQIQIDQIIAASLEQIGITVEVERLEVGAFRSSYNTYDINLNTLVTFNVDPDFILGLYSGAAGEGIFHFNDPKYLELLAASRVATPENRQTAISAAAGYLWDNQVTLYLADEFWYFIVNNRVQGYKRAPLLGEIFVQDAEISA